MTKIFLVDDHPLVCEWLTNLIQQQAGMTVCGTAGDAPRALEKISATKPNVVIVDLSIENGSGIELIKNIRALDSGAAVLVFSMHEERFYAERALRAGARGYIMKRETADKIIGGIRDVLAGKLCVSPNMAALLAQKLVDGHPTGDRSPIEQLSDRELEVFQLLGQGIQTRQVAETLRVSMKTIQVYCARIKAKLKLANAAELLREAIRWHDQHPSA